MLEELRCPNSACRAPLDDLNVVGEMGYCPKCGYCFRVTEGTLALTGKYGLDLPDLTQSRIDAELIAFRDYESNCKGKLGDCKERLTWGAERYAKLPPLPELLELKEVHLSLKGFLIGFFIYYDFGGMVLLWLMRILFAKDTNSLFDYAGGPVVIFAYIAWFIVCMYLGQLKYFSAKKANGNRPAENARRQKEYEKAKAEAMRDGERIKEREDYRLKEDIRKLSGIIESVHEKAENIRRDYEERVRTSQRNRY